LWDFKEQNPENTQGSGESSLDFRAYGSSSLPLKDCCDVLVWANDNNCAIATDATGLEDVLGI
ncbi:MAG TPA: hypothetical protein K8W18_07255, partial [Corynebacterium glutamicum]|nr:hypothetical protein [Corynebacterium glutamicum]